MYIYFQWWKPSNFFTRQSDHSLLIRGRRGHDCMVFTISAFHHLCCEFESCSGEVYSIQHYVIKFVSDLRQISGFLNLVILLKYC